MTVPRDDDKLEPLTTMLDSVLGDLISPAPTFAERFSSDGTMEFPYAPPGAPSHATGPTAIASYLDGVMARIALDTISDIVVHRTREPGTAILEYRGDGRIVRTGRPYVQRYVSVIRTAYGSIERWVDYWNPVAAADAFSDAT